MLRVVAATLVLAIVQIAPLQAETIESKLELCTGCHGEKGVPVDTTTPVIWGQNAGYLYLQLKDFQKGARKNEVMTAIAATLAKEDLLAFAEYFAAKPWTNIQQPAASPADVKTAKTVMSAIGCSACHTDLFLGDASVPHVAGQQHDYLAKTMMDFKTGARGNNPGMSDLMNAASDAEIKAIANYLAGL